MRGMLITTLSLSLFYFSPVAPSRADTFGTLAYNTCTRDARFMASYRRMPPGKAMVVGFTSTPNGGWRAECYSQGNVRSGQAALNVAYQVCNRNRWANCWSVFVGNKFTSSGRNMHRLAVADAAAPRPSQRLNWTNGDQQVVEGVIGILGAVVGSGALNRGGGGGNGSYSPPPSNGGGGSSDDCDWSTGACSAK
ncbi:hypothetical protein MesoLj131b_71060 (plasmid) [Mesorhizobium sp. 131-2-5]|nr:hypothetical protein MesoLj131b_71060 [Mesorhizobium sp. 131-2-5]